MTPISRRILIHVPLLALAGTLAFAVRCEAQGGYNNANAVMTQQEQDQTNQQLKQRTIEGQSSNQGSSAQAPKVDPKEAAAYKAFFDTNPQDADMRIQLGEAFVQMYPMGPYTESVYAGLVQAYYIKQDWKNFYASADKALAIKPDDVDVLVTVGWVIPHVYNPDDADAAKLLDKAQADETLAIQTIPTLPKPPSLTDEQFTADKNDKLAEAHSGLGLVYFRRKDYDHSTQELKLATQGASHPDPTDFFALGAALQNTGHYADAADAFDHCAQISSSLQDRCKQNADAAKKLAAQTK